MSGLGVYILYYYCCCSKGHIIMACGLPPPLCLSLFLSSTIFFTLQSPIKRMLQLVKNQSSFCCANSNYTLPCQAVSVIFKTLFAPYSWTVTCPMMKIFNFVICFIPSRHVDSSASAPDLFFHFPTTFTHSHTQQQHCHVFLYPTLPT